MQRYQEYQAICSLLSIEGVIIKDPSNVGSVSLFILYFNIHCDYKYIYWIYNFYFHAVYLFHNGSIISRWLGQSDFDHCSHTASYRQCQCRLLVVVIARTTRPGSCVVSHIPCSWSLSLQSYWRARTHLAQPCILPWKFTSHRSSFMVGWTRSFSQHWELEDRPSSSCGTVGEGCLHWVKCHRNRRGLDCAWGKWDMDIWAM